MARKKARKYAGITDQLPKHPGYEPDRREILDLVKAEVLAPSADSDSTFTLQELLDSINARMTELVIMQKRATNGRRYASEFARVYAECRMIADTIDEWRAKVQVLIEVYQLLMVDQLENEGITSITLDNGQPVTTYPEPYAQVMNKEEFRLWCLDQKDSTGVRILEREMVLPWAKTNSLVKELLLAGQPEPKGVTTYSITKVRLGKE